MSLKGQPRRVFPTHPVKTPRWFLALSSTKKQIESWVWHGVARQLMSSEPSLNLSPSLTIVFVPGALSDPPTALIPGLSLSCKSAQLDAFFTHERLVAARVVVVVVGRDERRDLLSELFATRSHLGALVGGGFVDLGRIVGVDNGSLATRLVDEEVHPVVGACLDGNDLG